MLLKKKGFPEEDEILMCNVTKIHFHSVFVTLDEYGGRTGLIHISEVSPGRIRNISDFVVEGKKVVCKVLRVDQEKGHIDLSLRRVNEGQKRNKVNEVKQEQKAEKILEFVAKELKVPVGKIYEEVASKTLEKYNRVYPAFEEAVKNESLLKDLGISDKIVDPLMILIKQRIKEAEVEIGGNLKLITYTSNGIEDIKKALDYAEKTDDNVKIFYEGGGKYKITVKAPDYKKAEKILNDATGAAIDYLTKQDGEGSFERVKSE